MTQLLRNKETKISLYLAAILALGVGFADLWRGGITVSAILLAVAYCGLIPLAIWAGGSAAERAPSERPPYLPAGVAALLVLALYIVTMAPSTAMWDTSEYIAAAYTFGLPHPPGNPFFIIVGRVFSILPIAPNVAARINVLAALSSAIAAGLWFLVTEHVMKAWIDDKRLRLIGAGVATLISATAFTVWNQSVVNEKVYTVSLTGIALISWLAVRWSANPDDDKADRMLVLIAYLCGLGYANHMAGMLPAPAVGLAVLLRKPTTIFRWPLLVACFAAIVVGMTPFATQPIRAAHFPAVNEGEPTACRTKLELKCTLSNDTYRAFMYNFNRGQYGKPDLADRQASFGEQAGMWWLYFKWQWLRDPEMHSPFTQALLAASFFVLGLAGAWVHYTRDRKTFWYFGSMMFTMTLLLIYYLNFKLGASQDPGSPNLREVRDRDYFFLWSYSAWGVWAGLGLVWLWETLAESLSWRKASPVLALGLVPLFTNWTSASRANHQTTRNVAADLLNSVEPYGVLVTVGDNDTFPLWYAQEVEGIRRDVVIANTSLLNTDWYARQVIRSPVREYDAARGPAVYRDRPWTKPAAPPLKMTLDEADRVPAYYQLPGPTLFTAGPYKATIDPRNLEHGVLERADALVLRMIVDSWQERPVYFARSAAGYPRQLGLGDNVLTQGLASKLFVPPATPSRDTVLVQGDGWLDVARTKKLWNEVFTGHTSAIAEGHWIDHPSASMPLLYVFAGSELGDVLRARGEMAEAQQVLRKAQKVADAAGYPQLVSMLAQQLATPVTTGDSSGITLSPAARNQPKIQSTDPVRTKAPPKSAAKQP
jgi:hypothetical protein